ncbi:MAG: hypothetical protein OEQ18_02155 [Gammaproteobacteria bacterium]|nr:hypothetical protein [Gammaproteobacteria bacterium]
MNLSSDMAAMLRDQLALGEGELIQYCPYQAAPRLIQAMVDRSEPVSEFVGGGEMPVIRYAVTVVNDAVLGVVGPQVGRDLFVLKVQRDELAPVPFRLSRILRHDTGAYTLEVVK